MRSQHVGWNRLWGFVTGVGDYVRASAGRPRRHSAFGRGCRGKTDGRRRGGHGKQSREPTAHAAPGTRHTALAPSLAATIR